MKKFTRLAVLTAFTFLLCFQMNGWGQINISIGNTITQDFTIGSTTTAPLPTGWKADKNTTARTLGSYASAVSATEQIAGNSMSATAANGIYNYAAGVAGTATDRAVGGISSSSASKSVNVYAYLTNNGASTIDNFTISYNVEKYRMGTNAAGYSIQMYYSTNGTSWTSAGSDFLTSFAADASNNGYASAPGATSSVSNKTLSISLSSSSPLYLAWNYSVTTGTTTSNAQALGIDDISITANGTVTPPSWTPGWPKAEGATPTGFIAKVNISAVGTAYFVVLPNGATAPTSEQVKAGQDAMGLLVASGMSGSIACAAAATEYTSAVTGLSSSTTYNVYFVAEASSAIQSSPTMVSVTTGSSAAAPSISSLTVTSVTDNSAVLGANVTSDGGSAITARGTLWKTSAGVTISDNLLEEGTDATGVFTHSRTSLPAETQIFYTAYATNSVGSTLVSPESSFYTLSVEPSTHAGSFAASATGANSIDLSWTAATGAEGYLILQKTGTSAPTGTPSDANGYAVSNTIGDATVAAIVTSGAATTQSLTGLSGGTQYYFTIIPYAFDGVNAATYNYNTTATIPSATATTTEASIYWDGGASTTAWADAANWSGNVVPGATDLVVLDNSLVSGNYSVELPSGTVKTSIKRLIITPASSTDITLTLPATNTYGASNDGGFVVGDNTAETDDIVLNDGAVLVNASGASSGNGIQVILANGVCRINNGGKFVHSSLRSTAGIVPLLSIVSGTETGVFEYDSPGTGSISLSASNRNYGSLTLTRTAGVATYTSLGSNALTVRGNFVMNTGVTYNTTMTGAFNLGGNFTNNGVAFNTTTQAVTFNGTSLQTISGNGSNNFSGGLTLSNAAGVTLSGAATVSNLNVTTGAFTIASGASLITTGTVTGSSVVERFITKYDDAGDDMYHFLSSPVAAQAIATTFSDPANNSTNDFFKFDEATYTWINHRATGNIINPSFEENFVVGRGYLVAYVEDVTKSFTGTLNTGAISAPTMTYTSSLSNPGWNLIGNPYPSAIDWDLVATGQYANMDNAVYVYDNSSATYKSYVGATESTPGAGSLTEGIIPSMQGFFVHANDEDSPSLSLENADRVHGGATYYKNGTLENVVRLKVEGNNRYDETYIRFNDEASTGFDSSLDAFKLYGGSSVPTFYTLADDRKLSVNSLPTSSLEGFVPLAVEAGAANTYSISIVENSLPASTYVTLEDTKTGSLQRLNDQPTYSFTAAPGEDPNRFRLHFKDATSVSDPSSKVDFTAYAINGQLNVLSSVSGKLSITDMAGKTLSIRNITKGELNTVSLNGVTGLYLVKLSSSQGNFIQKVVVK